MFQTNAVEKTKTYLFYVH